MPLSSHRSGKCRTISKGIESDAINTNFALPLLTNFVTSLTPLTVRPAALASVTSSNRIFYYAAVANGFALGSIK